MRFNCIYLNLSLNSNYLFFLNILFFFRLLIQAFLSSNIHQRCIIWVVSCWFATWLNQWWNLKNKTIFTNKTNSIRQLNSNPDKCLCLTRIFNWIWNSCAQIVGLSNLVLYISCGLWINFKFLYFNTFCISIIHLHRYNLLMK